MSVAEAEVTAEPRILLLGDTALSVDFGNRIDADLNGRVIALDKALRELGIPGVIETVPTYRALTVHVDPLTVDREALMETLRSLARSVRALAGRRRRFQVPVVFGGAFGLDLELIARHAGLSPDAFVETYCASVYSVFMIGFLPGFSYLGGLDPRLAMPRRPEPRLAIPASSVSIGGFQTAIGTVEGPSGWHLIGRTPVRPFVRGRDPVFLFEAGDEIVFHAIPEADWPELDRAAAAGEVLAREVSP